MKSLEKRIETLETLDCGKSFVVLLQQDGEAKEDVLARWERDNGPVGKRQALVVMFINALDAQL